MITWLNILNIYMLVLREITLEMISVNKRKRERGGGQERKREKKRENKKENEPAREIARRPAMAPPWWHRPPRRSPLPAPSVRVQSFRAKRVLGLLSFI